MAAPAAGLFAGTRGTITAEDFQLGARMLADRWAEVNLEERQHRSGGGGGRDGASVTEDMTGAATRTRTRTGIGFEMGAGAGAGAAVADLGVAAVAPVPVLVPVPVSAVAPAVMGAMAVAPRWVVETRPVQSRAAARGYLSLDGHLAVPPRRRRSHRRR